MVSQLFTITLSQVCAKKRLPVVTPYCVFAELVSETVCLRSDSCWLEILYQILY